MYIWGCFNSFLEDFPLFKTMSSSRMWISYGINSDKNVCKILNNFTREKKISCFFFLLYLWPLLSRGHQRSCINWCAVFRWPQKVKVEHIQAWKIAHPMPIGAQNSGAQNLRDVSDFLRWHIWPCNNKKLMDLQVFRRISKTMKKLYKLQIQPQTPAYL